MSLINESNSNNNISDITGLPISLTNNQGIEQQFMNHTRLTQPEESISEIGFNIS